MRENQDNRNKLKKVTDRLYGGIPMTWTKVVLLAAASAVVTAIFLIQPVFKNSSFERMGVHFEAWIFLAVLIMANCEKPLEAALKTFVFFLISQPLIYLIQVPFSSLGWGLFGYYRTWFLWTLLTFPMACAGWYIRRKDWLSLLILAPVLIYLMSVSVSSFRFAIIHFPRLLLTALFCLLQVLLYLYAFCGRPAQRLAGFLVPLLIAALLLWSASRLNINSTLFLPGDPVLTEEARVSAANPKVASITIENTGEDSMIRIQASRYGSTDFLIADGAREYRYGLTIYEDDAGSVQIRITEPEA